MDDDHDYGFLELNSEDIIKLIDNHLTGPSILHKFWHAIGAVVFITCKMGLKKQNLLNVISSLYDHIAPTIDPDPAFKAPINALFESSRIELMSKSQKDRMSNMPPSLQRLTEKDFN